MEEPILNAHNKAEWEPAHTWTHTAFSDFPDLEKSDKFAIFVISNQMIGKLYSIFMNTTILTGLYEAPQVKELTVCNGSVLCGSFNGNTVEDWTEEDI